MIESILVIIGLGIVAGGGIIVIDALVVRKIRRIDASSGGNDAGRRGPTPGSS